MKKSRLMSSLFALLILLSGASTHPQAGNTKENGIKDVTESIVVTIKNDLTGETKIVENAVIEQIYGFDLTSPQQRLLGEESFYRSYEIFIPLEAFGIDEKDLEALEINSDGTKSIVPLNTTIIREPQNAGASATLGVNYTTRSNQTQINITRAWGNWVPGRIFYMANQSWGVATTLHPHLNRGHHSISGRPTSNSFSQNITWGWVDRFSGDLSPRAWSQATVRSSGMDATFTLIVEFNF